eukprot:scaffold17176_cov70-Phaeocystis_antarctica.AAC.1
MRSTANSARRWSRARAGGRAVERALVRVVERREDLRLDRVEVREGRRARPQRRDGQRTQVEQLRVRRVLLGQNEVAEGDGKRGLGAEPAVGDDADEVLRRQRVADRDGEGDRVVVLGESGLEDEDLMVQHTRSWSTSSTSTRDGELDAQHGARDGLHVRSELEQRELVDEA